MGNTGQSAGGGRNSGGALRSGTNQNQSVATKAEQQLFANAHVMATPPGGPTSRAPSPQLAAYQRRMGQSGDEAGKVGVLPRQKLYVGTSKAFNINRYLETDGKSIKAKGSDWDQNGYTKAMIKNDIAKIDSGMAGLPRDTRLTRFVYGSQLGAMLGGGITDGNIGTLIKNLASGDAKTVQNFRSLLKGADYTHKGYTSTTYVQNHPGFDTRNVRLNFVARQGTKAIATNNHAEHEILLGRNLKYNFTGDFRVVRTAKGVDQLIVDVYS